MILRLRCRWQKTLTFHAVAIFSASWFSHPRSEALCRKALDAISKNLGLMPRNFDVEEMRRDLTSPDALNTRNVRLIRLLEKAHDTDMALGSDVMVAALEGYSFLKTSGKAEGVDALRKLLGKRFEGAGRKQEGSTGAQAPALASA
jgi:hypothetical protein